MEEFSASGPVAGTPTQVEAIAFRDIADRVIQGLWVRSADGSRCIYINHAFKEIWGRNLEQMNAQPWAMTVHPDDREAAHAIFLKHKERKHEYKLSYRIVRPNGEVRWVENHAFPVLDAEGNLVRMAGIALDVTERRKMEEELRIAQKLESLGQLSAGIAHEVNTPSQYVSDNISFLQEAVRDIVPVLQKLPALMTVLAQSEAGKPLAEELRRQHQQADIDYLIEEMPQALAQAKGGIEQIKKIVMAMKGFTHPGEEMVPADINQIVSNTVTVTRNEWKYIAELESSLCGNLPLVPCIPSAIGQVILNILVNASHALKEKYTDGRLGRIRIATALADGWVRVCIEDNGPGVPVELRERIFDPFFTTKEVGKGTGQGLSFVHKIVRVDHKGKVLLESTPGGGATFTIMLPLEPGGTANKQGEVRPSRDKAA